jgi:large subunit ribosomal protein L11
MCTTLKVVKLKLFIPAGGLAATPPFGPILGQYGINTIQLCKEFNEITEGLNLFFNDLSVETTPEFLLSVDVFINEDKTYRYVINKPPVSFLLRLLTQVKRGAPQTVAGTISLKELIFLAQFKFPAMDLFLASKVLLGTARSIGITVTR